MSTISKISNLPIPEPLSDEPTGVPYWPRILVGGEEGALKSTTVALMSADERLGRMYWLEIGRGESTAHEYGKLPGVRYRIIRHDGKFSTIYGQLCAHWQLAKQAEEKDEPPIPLGLDSMTGLWQMITSWLDLLARRRVAAQAERKNRKPPKDLWDPEFDPQIGPDLWNLGNRRWNMVLDVVQQWPGPVAYTAREKQVTVFGPNGQPDPRADKVWTLETQKQLGFESSVWLRLTREGKPQVVKMRSAQPGLIKLMTETKKDQPVLWKQGREDTVNLGELVFDVLGCEATKSRAPEVKVPDADEWMPGERPVDYLPEQPNQGRQTGGRQQRQQQPAADTAELGRAASEGMKELLATSSAVNAMAWLSHKPADPYRGIDVSGFLDDAGWKLVGVPRGTAVTFQNLARAHAAHRAVEAILDSPDVDAAAKRHTWVQGSPLAEVDVARLVPEEDAERLGLTPGETVTLNQLGERVVVYVGKHGPVRAPVDKPDVLRDQTGAEYPREEIEQHVRENKQMMREAVGG